jgi:ribosomal protein S18 acetylase RimI-like enzyme
VPDSITYRPFLNTDPPLIVDIWRRQPTFRGLYPNLTTANFEQHVLSKPYFERHGLIVATNGLSGDDLKMLGFVHASFDVREDLSDLDFQTGVISQLRVEQCETRLEIEDELLRQAEAYLIAKGARRAYFGGRFPQAPFYLGLYGGSRLPGVMEQDKHVLSALKRAGYLEQDRIAVMERQLGTVRSVSGRQQLTVRRNYLINAIADPIEKSWWECCTLGMAERDRFSIGRKRDNHVAGSVSYWDLQPIGSYMDSNCRGLYDLSVNEEDQRQGLASFLVSESMKRLASQGVTLVEAQASVSNEASLKLFQKLEFTTVTHASVMAKDF